MTSAERSLCEHACELRGNDMPTQSEIERLSELVSAIAETIVVCRDLAPAHVEAGEPWWHPNRLEAWLAPTDFQRMRRRVLRLSRQARGAISAARRDAPNADLIRCEHAVRQAAAYCRECPGINLNCDREGRRFQCLIAASDAVAAHFRFRLGTGGTIHEA